MSSEAKATSPTTTVTSDGALVTDLRPPAPGEARDSTRPAPNRTAAETVRAVRRGRAKRLALKIASFVLVPTCVAAIYLFAVASDRFESVSLFTINASDARPSLAMEGLMGLVGGAATTRDTLAVRDFVLSRAMLADLDEHEGFIAHYRSPSADVWSRLSASSSFEEAFEYYRDVVVVGYDSNSNVLTLRVRAYSAERARAFARRILARSETMVNELADRARADQIRFAQVELGKAEVRLSAARRKLVDMQVEHGELNPEQTAAAAMTIRTALESELAKARADLAALRSYMAPEAPQVIAAQERVRSLAGQAAGESQRLVSKKGDRGLHASLASFEEVAVEKEFAMQMYQSALATLEIARADAARQHRYLATIAEPSAADEAQFPRRWLGVLTAFLASFLAFGIGSLVLVTVKEHARL